MIISRINIRFVFVSLSVLWLFRTSSMAQRQQISLNENWTFQKIENQKIAEEKAIHLPHTWNAKDAFDDQKGYFQGLGIYKKAWFAPQSWEGKKVFLQIDGANHTALVFLNGQKLGEHRGGYTKFRFEATPWLLYGKENQLEIRVSNLPDSTIAPVSGDFTFYGGIYRNVWVIITEPTHFEIDKEGSDGIWVQPEGGLAQAFARISGEIIQKGKESVQLISTLKDGQGKALATATQIFKGKEGKARFSQKLISKESVKNWSPDEPNLYSIHCQLFEGKKLMDELVITTGFYDLKISADSGAFLNGKSIKLLGACRHQDHANIGNALPDEIHRQDVKDLKEMGANFLRIAHYPQADAILESCNKLGILVWEEIPIVNEIHLGKAFAENAKSQLKEMILQHRNHPSVAMWGFMNEVLLAVIRAKNPENIVKQHIAETKKLTEEVNLVCKSLDPKRLTTIAFDVNRPYNASGIAGITDLTGWNLYHGWYHDTFEDFGKFMDREHAQFPARKHLISEFGAGSDLRINALAPRLYDFSPQYQRNLLHSYLKQILARPWIAGAVVWNLVDFGSEDRRETMPHINNKGLLTMDRRKKDNFYLFQALLSPKPMAHFAIRDFENQVFTDELGNVRLPIFTNQQNLEIWINGSMAKNIKAEDSFLEWNWINPPGEAFIELRTPTGKILDQSKIQIRKIPNPKSSDFQELAVNVGSTCAFQSKENPIIWWPSKSYSPGSYGTVGGEVFSAGNGRLGTTAFISQTEEQPLFQTMQSGLKQFRADVETGLFEVELLFAELQPKVQEANVLYDLSKPITAEKENAQRRFHVRINGKMWLENFTPDQGKGPVAFRFKTKIRVEKEGITVDFEAIEGKPILNGIRIVKLN